MIPPALAPDESERLEALRSLNILDTPAQESFDRITRLACRALGVPIAAVTLVDSDRQWFKSRQGLADCETDRRNSFCAHVILGAEALVVPDAALDARFSDNPLVTGEPFIRFYAGVPLTARGRRVGALCVIDRRPRSLDEADMRVLVDLARMVEEEFCAVELGEALARLRESEERFRQFAENITEVFWISSPEATRILYVSPAYEKIWGRSRESLYERPSLILGVVHRLDRVRVVRELQKHAKGADFDIEYRVVMPDGAVRWVHARTFPIRDAAGKVYRVAGIAEDITNHKELLRKSEKLSAIGQLLAGVTHEINNPLATIHGFAQSALKRLTINDPMILPMSVIAREAERCRGLVRDMLSFSREGRVAAGELVLNEAVAGVMSIVEAQAKTKDIRVVTRFGGEERLTGDKNQLQQVVINLCGNAVDALPRGGRLEIAIGRRARAGGEDIVLTVADNGPGIPAELREKIFEPFFTTKEDGKGTGLGLSLVRDIVERHRGRIELDSQLGRGTTFTLAFPCARGRGAADAGAEAPPAPEERGARI